MKTEQRIIKNHNDQSKTPSLVKIFKLEHDYYTLKKGDNDSPFFGFIDLGDFFFFFCEGLKRTSKIKPNELFVIF